MQINWRPSEHTAVPIKYCYDLSSYLNSIYLPTYTYKLQIQGKIRRRSHFAKVIRSAKIPSANAMHFSITFNLSWKTQGTKFCRPNYFFRASKVQCAILRSDRLAEMSFVSPPNILIFLHPTQLVGKVVTCHERFQKKPINPSFFNPYGIIWD